MTQISFEELTKPVTAKEWKASMYRVLGIVGTDVTLWNPFAFPRTLIAISAWGFGGLSLLVAEIAKGGYLELAQGKWLDLIAWYVYRVLRPQATFAPGEITVTNTGGGVYDFEVDEFLVSSTLTGKSYRNTSAFSLGVGEVKVVPIKAVEQGSASTAPAGTINTVETSVIGVTVTNAAAVVGQDEGKDPELRTLCLEKTGNVSVNGPVDAYAYAARTAKRQDGTLVGVNRAKAIKDGYGGIRVVVATATGALTGTYTDPATDLGAVQANLDAAAATLNDIPEAESAVEETVNVTYQAWVLGTPSLTTAELKTNIETALAAHLATNPIGGFAKPGEAGKVFHDALETTIRAVLSSIYHVEVQGTDIPVSANAIPLLGTVTGTITLVEGSA